MGLIEEILKNKEEIIVKFLEILEGKEAKAKVNLDGVKFHVGSSLVEMTGNIEFTFVPIEKREA